MVKSPTGIIPQELNTAKQLPDVIRFLNSTAIPVSDKYELLFGWARNVGVKLRASDYQKLDVQGPV